MRCAERFVAASLLAFSAALPTAAGEPSLEVVAPVGAVAVGDPVTLRVQARGGDGGLFGELEVATKPGGPWEVVQRPRRVADARPPAWEVVLAPMAVGELEAPEMTVTVRSPEGSTFDARARTAAKVTVASVLAPDDAKEPAPLLDPIGPHGMPWEWIPPFLVLASPLLAAGVLWLRRRRLQGDEVPAAMTPLDELRRAAADLQERIGRQPVEGVCDRLATAVRRFLERRTGEPALEMTSFEIRRRGRSLGWPEEVRRHLQRVFETTDGIRFGRRSGTEDALRTAVDSAVAAALRLEEYLRPVDNDRESSRELAS